MSRKNIISKIKEQAYENVNKNLEKEKKKIEEKIKEEIDEVEEILKYIKNKLIYKKVGSNWNYNYALVTEEMFFQDYNTEPEYNWRKGIEIRHNRENKYEPFIKVNGEDYYDIRYIIRNYEEDFEKFYRRLNNLNQQFRDIENGVRELKSEEPAIKKLIEEYQSVNIEEERENC